MALIAAACSSDSDDTTTTAAGGTDETTTTAEATTTTAGGTDETTTTAAAGSDYAGLMVEAACDDPTNKSNINTITAVDAHTVAIQLCTVDVAFPSKVAFSAFGIVPQEYLDSTGGTGALLDERSALAPTCSRSGTRATRS